MYRRNHNGGWNKRYETAEDVPRIDSFELAQLGTWAWIASGSRFIEVYHDDAVCDLFPPCRPDSVTVQLSHKRNGYGGGQLFFLCPACKTRRRYLYQLGNAFLCRKCGQLNFRSSQETRSDPMYFYDLGVSYAREHLEILDPPDGFAFCNWIPPRPRYMHMATYQKHLRRLMKYQIKHMDRLIEDFQKILI